MDTGKVNIHGKQYSTVALRVKEFREKHKLELSIVTELVERDDSTVVMKASILDGKQNPIATGYAEERRDASMINKTSALENCETSAIGRALAAFGMAGTEYASADEVANAISNQNNKSPKAQQATTKQIEMLFNLAKQQGYTEKADAHKWLSDEAGKDVLLSSSAEASKLIGKLMEK